MCLPDLEERLIVCWLNAQEFPSALLCNRVQDLRSGVILHELASIVLLGEDPASDFLLFPRARYWPQLRLPRVIGNF